VLAADAWSLWLWDARGRPRFARSRWRSPRESHADIALEIERLIVAYVHGDASRGVERVHVLAGEEAVAMAAALDARLRDPCIPLAAESGTGEGARGKASAVWWVAGAGGRWKSGLRSRRAGRGSAASPGPGPGSGRSRLRWPRGGCSSPRSTCARSARGWKRA